MERLESLEAFLREDPANATLRAEAAMVAVEAGLTDRAGALLSAAPAPSDAPELQHARGFVALAAHRFADAVEIFEALFEAGADAHAVRFNLAYARFRSGDLVGAEADFRRLLGAEGAPPQSLAYLVRSLHGQGRIEAAIEAWEQAPAASKTAQTAGVVSLVSLDAGRPEEALRLSESALAAPEPPPEALVTRATLMVGEGDIVHATQLLEQARRAAPDDGRVWSALGTASLLGGDIGQAEQAFKEACNALPQHVGSWVTLGWCQILRRDFAAARTSLEAAVALDRNFAETHGAVAVVSALQGKSAEAEVSIEKALRLDRKSLSARYAQAILRGEASDRDAIEALALRLLRGRPGPDGTVLLERVMAAARGGRS